MIAKAHVRRKRLLCLAVCLAILALMAWALRDVSPAQVCLALRQVTLGQLLLLAAVNAGILLLFSCRWWCLLRAQGFRLPYLALASYRLAAFGVSFFTPGPQLGGEPLQVYLVHKRHALPGAAAIASVTLDKLLELLANFAFLSLGIYLAARGEVFAAHLPVATALPALALFLLPGVYLAYVFMGKTPLTSLLRSSWLPIERIPRLVGAREAVASAEGELVSLLQGEAKTLIVALGLSLVVWLALLGEYWLAARFVGLHLTFIQIVALLTAARLAFLSPLPGGFGVVEASQVLALQAMGLDPAAGLSLVLLARARDMLLGLLGLGWGGWLAQRALSNPLPIPTGD
ncbi:MAG: lysylphosphatidylglycerol synthase transmembrane domain-containing protein [Anaerolineales bacterium]|nr:lysylphosphatidylglycerol synthase transmembrane domain-containing protein [Anaerolineales bacterium]